MVFDASLGWDSRPVERMAEDDAAEAARGVWVEHPVPVAVRARMVVQPAGGFLPLSLFDRVALGDPCGLRPARGFPPALEGLAVDYLVRAASGVPVRDAFRVPLLGARLVRESDRAERLAGMVRGFDDRSVGAALLLCAYDAASRRGPERWRRPRLAWPSEAVVWNVRRMVARARAFLDVYGPVVWEGFSFDGAYTELVTSGSGDYLTGDGLWDMKVSRYAPNPVYTLQILMYWRMGLRSVHHERYAPVRRLGLFNPRLDEAWMVDMDRIPDEVREVVDRDVIGYGRDDPDPLPSSA